MSLIKQIALLIVLVAIAGGGYAAYERYATAEDEGGGSGRRGGGPVAVETAAAETRTIENKIEAVGSTLARRAVEIVPMATGRIDEIGFLAGDRVNAGDVLATLDDDIQKADLTEARARLDEATLAKDRAATLGRTNAVSQASIDQLTSALAAAQAQLDRAERRMADREVKAPFSGILGFNKVEIGARVTESTVITTLDDLSEVEVEFSLPETVFGTISMGLPVTATSTAFPNRKFTGSITSIDSRVDPVSRAFKVRAIVPNEDLALPAGMFMHLTVVLDAHEGLMIPEEAVVVEAEATFVYTVADGKAARQDVTLGRREFGSVEVTEGVEDGEMVVTRGVHRLRDGAAVRVAGDDATDSTGRPKEGPPGPSARGGARGNGSGGSGGATPGAAIAGEPRRSGRGEAGGAS